MPLEKKLFTDYGEKTQEKMRVISLKLNEEEQKRLKSMQKLLRQPKEGTTLKILVEIGEQVILDQLTGKVLNIVFENKRRNKRLGITDDLI